MPHHIVARLSMGGHDFTFKAYLVGWTFFCCDGTRVKFSGVEFFAKRNDKEPLWSGFLGWVDRLQNVVTYAANEVEAKAWMHDNWKGIKLPDKHRARWIVHEAVQYHLKRENEAGEPIEFLPRRSRVALNPEEERPALPVSDSVATLSDA